MGQIIFAFIYYVFRLYIGTVKFDKIKELVLNLLNEDIPKDQKRAQVIEWAKQEFDNLSSTVINAVVEMVLLKNKIKK